MSTRTSISSSSQRRGPRLCFIIEERYRDEEMPIAVAERLLSWHVDVDVVEPFASPTCVSSLVSDAGYDAVVLKTVPDGPGLSLLEAVAAFGVRTINDVRAIRLVRDKAVAAAFARAHGIPFPHTYLVASPDQLRQVPASHFPLVVKPANGSACRDVVRLDSPDAPLTLAVEGLLLAQPYVANPGHDVKVYVTGEEMFAVRRRSPLHRNAPVVEELVPVSAEMRALALAVRRVFGLDVYGVDLVETPAGFVVLDINDFPSFGLVPDAIGRVARTLLRLASEAALASVGRRAAARRASAGQASIVGCVPAPHRFVPRSSGSEVTA